MSAGDVRFEAAGLNGCSYNTSKPGPISAIFSRTLSCSALAPSHVSLTPSVTQAQRGGEVCVRMCGRLDSSRDKRLNGSHTWLSADTFVASELSLQLPRAVWVDLPGCPLSLLNSSERLIHHHCNYSRLLHLHLKFGTLLHQWRAPSLNRPFILAAFLIKQSGSDCRGVPLHSFAHSLSLEAKNMRPIKTMCRAHPVSWQESQEHVSLVE